MMHTRLLILAIGLCLSTLTPVAAEQQIRLKFDPFNRPDLETLPKPIAVKIEEEKLPDVWEARLYATIRSGSNSLANVNGNIIAIGESIEGYRLVEVHERIAVFMKKGKRYILNLDGTKERNDERNLSAVK